MGHLIRAWARGKWREMESREYHYFFPAYTKLQEYYSPSHTIHKQGINVAIPGIRQYGGGGGGSS
jgi:hypothetical protein